jgi:hypothetical protein
VMAGASPSGSWPCEWGESSHREDRIEARCNPLRQRRRDRNARRRCAGDAALVTRRTRRLEATVVELLLAARVEDGAREAWRPAPPVPQRTALRGGARRRAGERAHRRQQRAGVPVAWLHAEHARGVAARDPGGARVRGTGADRTMPYASLSARRWIGTPREANFSSMRS